MAERTIRIDQTGLTIHSGRPFEFAGVHSGKDLSGIDLNITAYSEVEASEIDELLKNNTVEVEDPFTDRQYKAILTSKSSIYQEGRSGKRYHFKVKELDEAPRFAQLEVNGHCFDVLKNTESLHKDVIGIHTLLRLSPEEFLKFRSLLELDSFEIRRLGIDESPVVRRLGGALYWSSHQEQSQRYYKQIVRFFPTDDPPPRIHIAIEKAQSRMILALSARYEALVKMLVENGQISQENGEDLISGEWRGMINDERRIILHSKLTEVADAEIELD